MGAIIATERIDLGDGQYAVFYSEKLHRTQKAISLLTRPYLKFGNGNGESPKMKVKDGDINVEGLNNVEVFVELDKVDWDAVNDALIVGQIAEWSFGERVDQATLDGLPERIRERLKAECNRLYGAQNPLPNGGGEN